MTAQTEIMIGLSGISRGFAVSLSADGNIRFAIEEDKLRRFRGLGLEGIEAVGSRGLDHLLTHVPEGIRGIDRVVYVPPIQADSSAAEAQASRVAQFLVRHYGQSPDVSIIDHAAAHIAFERAVHGSLVDVLMVGRSRAVYSCCRSDAYQLDIDLPVVSFIENCARFIGLEAGRIHHLENMARLGEPRFADRLSRLLEARIGLDAEWSALSELTDVSVRASGDRLERIHYDVAASLFEVMRSEILGLLRSVVEGTSSHPVALCGGVFQSWRLNDAIATEFPNHEFLVSFSPGNPACAIGGPLAFSGRMPSKPLGPFLGPRYDSNEVKAVLDNCKARYAYHSHKEAVDLACSALESGKMVGWFEGACEFGYRALGARSVFANPADHYACDNLTSYLKRRPSYFSYAVAVKDDDPNIDVRSPFLSRSTRLPEYFGESAVRLQTVSKSRASGLYELLSAFQEKTGVRALLNTSLNYFDEPIACAPRDALKTFYASGLDLLVMQNFVLRKS